MKLSFIRASVPNFVATDKGMVDVKDLEDEEIELYIDYWEGEFYKNMKKRKALHLTDCQKVGK